MNAAATLLHQIDVMSIHVFLLNERSNGSTCGYRYTNNTNIVSCQRLGDTSTRMRMNSTSCETGKCGERDHNVMREDSGTNG